MAPSPKRQNPQHQPLTTALRKLIRDYPAGAGVFRELLQNADDAGATTVKFVLDTQSHPDHPVLVPGLEKYQGPALLAYNDAVFTKADFQSVTSLGDSRKLQDKAATGKFGLGFSSVYNYTDCPSIISGETLLFQDPHHSWTSSFHPPGGPEYEFPPAASDPAMINQLKGFSAIDEFESFDKPLHGTIIRLPLRTDAQAKVSKISTRETDISDIEKSLTAFAQEIGIQGLLFLKSVQRIVINIDATRLHDIAVVNASEAAHAKSILKANMHNLMNGKKVTNEEIYFEVEVRHSTSEGQTTKRYGLLHLLDSSVINSDLAVWAFAGKLFPWVAVAKHLDEHRNAGTERLSETATNLSLSCRATVLEADDKGRLFSVLPLPISTGFPVHIHGLFSISGDRSRLVELDDGGALDQNPKKWNALLASRSVPRAWAKLVSNICVKYPTQQALYLPPFNENDQSLWHRLTGLVTEHAHEQSLKIWPTTTGYRALGDALVALINLPQQEKDAFEEAQVPAVYLRENLYSMIQRKHICNILDPSTLKQYLLKASLPTKLSKESKRSLLEYLVQGLTFTAASQLPLVPFKDNTYRSLSSSETVFVHRSGVEDDTFNKDQHCTIDPLSFSSHLVTKLHEAATDIKSSVHYRTEADLVHYVDTQWNYPQSDILASDSCKSSTVASAWRWILQFVPRDRDPSALGTLHLVPVTSGGYRRLMPQDLSNRATFFCTEDLRSLASAIFDQASNHGTGVLADEDLEPDALQRLLEMARIGKVALTSGDDLYGFLDFLADCRALLVSAPTDLKLAIKDELKRLHAAGGAKSVRDKASILCSIPIFEALSWNESTDAVPSRSMTTCDPAMHNIGMNTLVPLPLPNRSKRVYFDLTNTSDRSFFAAFGVLDPMTGLQILKNLAIPALQDDDYKKLHHKTRRAVSELLLETFTKLSAKAQKSIRCLPLVPLQSHPDLPTLFASPCDIVDQNKQGILELFFDNEVKQPDQVFYEKFRGILSQCGIIQSVSVEVAIGRINSLADRDLRQEHVAARARRVLTNELSEVDKSSRKLIEAARDRAWLPATRPDLQRHAAKASTCRDERDYHIVSHVHSCLDFKVSAKWRTILGWDQAVPLPALQKQLESAIHEDDDGSVSHVLSYLGLRYSMDEYADAIKKLRFVRTTDGSLIAPSGACLSSAEGLSPFLHNVDVHCKGCHRELLKHMKVPYSPTMEQLKSVQSSLDKQAKDKNFHIEVAVKVAHLWHQLYPETLHELKVPTTNARLESLANIVYNDRPWIRARGVAFTHPNMSLQLCQLLKIRTLTELQQNDALGLVDEDDDEFDQNEDHATGIRDTLERYNKEATFQEYVANADDTGRATCASFMVDITTYPSAQLIAPGLADLQGPALLIHNDAVFTEQDFEGFRRVGLGSKRLNPNTIGKFGRGSQTMYHWTDMPILLSGEWIVILDPLRKKLPYNMRTLKRKPGVKVKFADLQKNCPNHLLPFRGLWGFDNSSKIYNGTIFRFPFRPHGHVSELSETQQSPTEHDTIRLFESLLDDARLSLMFLRNITSVEFQVRNDESSGWTISRGMWPAEDSFAGFADVVVHARKQSPEPTIARYWRAFYDIQDAPDHIPNKQKRRQKYMECGLAALVTLFPSQTSQDIQSRCRFFNCMPLKFESNLPVHVHATFRLSGDRQNIAIEDTAKEAGSEHNTWMLSEEVPNLYLKFLEALARENRDIYRFFPLEPPAGSPKDVLSSLVRDSFWRKLASSPQRVFPVEEKPVALEDSNKLYPRKAFRRRAPENIDSANANFCLLSVPADVQPLLAVCFDNLVCPPPRIKTQLLRSTQYKQVALSSIRLALSSTAAKTFVAKTYSGLGARKRLARLLQFILPGDMTNEHVAELDHSTVMPLCNGELGTISVNSGEKMPPMSYLVWKEKYSPEARELFAFANQQFIDTSGIEAIADRLMQVNSLNIKLFSLTSVPMILSHMNKWDIVSLTADDWLSRFWQFIQRPALAVILSIPSASETSKEQVLDLASIARYPLLLLHDGDRTHRLATLDELPTLPAVFASDRPDEQAFLISLHRLFVVDSKTTPTKYATGECNLSCVEAMVRLLKSLAKISESRSQSYVEFFKRYLKGGKPRKVLRNAIKGLSRTALQSDERLKPLFDLPIWSNLEGTAIRARDALQATSANLVVPFIKDFQRFTRKCPLLNNSLVDDETMLRQYVLPSLPDQLDIKDTETYVSMMVAVHVAPDLWQSLKNKQKRCKIDLHEYRIAANRARKLCLPSSLYSHSDPLFQAAFRGDSSKFLLEEVRNLESLWNSMGLRRRLDGRLQGSEYLECLKAIDTRRKNISGLDPMLDSDTKMVITPMCVSDGLLNNMPPNIWVQIPSLAVLPVKETFSTEPHYRQKRMQELASPAKTLSLSEIVSKDHMRVCWSQALWVEPEPSQISLRNARLSGEPTCETVWSHLWFLASLKTPSDLSAFRSLVLDIQATYQYLLARLEESNADFPSPQYAMWLNVDTTDPDQINREEWQSAWTSLDELILDSPVDAPPLRVARSFLAPYGVLLKKLGCQSIYYPPLAAPDLTDTTHTAMDKMRLFRKDRTLTDVAFGTEGDQSPVHAHKSILATKSVYIIRQFAGPWSEQDRDVRQTKIIPLEDMTHTALKTMIDFCYDEHTEWLNSQRVDGIDSLETIADKLDNLLDVLKASDRWQMAELHGLVENSLLAGVRFFIRPDNVKEVEELAEEAQAKRLHAYCHEFTARNANAVLLVEAS